MGLSNPAVCRLNMTWEVSRGWTSGNKSSLNLKFDCPFSFHRNFPASSGSFTGSLRTWWQVGPACCSLQNVSVLFSEQGAVWWSPMRFSVWLLPQDPSRNHRAYRLTVAKLDPPIIPFMPLLIKGSGCLLEDLLLYNKPCFINCFTFLPDMTFTQEGNKTFIDTLVNFEKMVRFRIYFFFFPIAVDLIADADYIFGFQRMIANTVKILRYCRSQPFSKCTRWNPVNSQQLTQELIFSSLSFCKVQIRLRPARAIQMFAPTCASSM